MARLHQPFTAGEMGFRDQVAGQQSWATHVCFGSKADIRTTGRHLFDESGLYAFTADRKGCILPSDIYPQVTWRFEQALTLRLDENSSRDQILRAALDGVTKRGFHLIHAAVYGELLGFTGQDIRTSH